MNTNEKLSSIAHAFVFDLDWQLEHGVSRKKEDQQNTESSKKCLIE